MHLFANFRETEWHFDYVNTAPRAVSFWMTPDAVLLIERWIMRSGQLGFEIRLPKGHVEAGETDEQAALRETSQETGYCAARRDRRPRGTSGTSSSCPSSVCCVTSTST